MHTLARHQLTTPVVDRGHFGLGTVASPCGNPAYRNSPEGREFCEREAERTRQAGAWAGVYRKLGINPPSVRPSDAELLVLARAASGNGDDVPVRSNGNDLSRQALLTAAALLAIPAAIFLLTRTSRS